MNIKSLLKLIVPPLFLRSRRNPDVFGEFASWESALEASGKIGYSTGNQNELRIFRSQLASNVQPSVWAWTTLAAVLFAATLRPNKLSVIDFGGGYGETYWQFRDFVGSNTSIEWNVVEIEGKVLIGKAEFQNDSIKFFRGIEEIPATIDSCLLFGGVLQYLSDPYALVAESLLHRPLIVALDRTPLLDDANGGEQFFVQKVPEAISGSAHPLRILNKERLENIFHSCGYRKIGTQDYASFPRDTSRGRYLAQIWKRS